jgi:aryl-alcohol dehydrogenase-like predicted oxidoreductase
MEYTRLGSTGLKISRLALGCMSYGDPTTDGAHRWALADEEAQPYFEQAVELGITFWDTSNNYQAGTSEEVVGGRSDAIRVARTSCWPPRCSAECTTDPVAPACPARPSWSRSTPP